MLLIHSKGLATQQWKNVFQSFDPASCFLKASEHGLACHCSVEFRNQFYVKRLVHHILKVAEIVCKNIKLNSQKVICLHLSQVGLVYCWYLISTHHGG